jgi:hypothetical protein
MKNISENRVVSQIKIKMKHRGTETPGHGGSQNLCASVTLCLCVSKM